MRLLQVACLNAILVVGACGRIDSQDTPTVSIDPNLLTNGNCAWAGAAGVEPQSHARANFNRAPSANAGLPRQIEVGVNTILDGGGSYDPDGDDLSYSWSVIERPLDSAAEISNPNAAQATWTPTSRGKYVFRLVVTDAYGASGSSDVAYISTAPGESLPAAYAGPSRAVSIGSTVRLDGARSYKPISGSASYSWALRTKPTGSNARLPNFDNVTTEFVADKVGTYTIDLEVRVGELASQTDSVTVIAYATEQSEARLDVSADYLVTDQVVRTNVEPIGMNLTRIAGGTNLATNNHFYGTGFEPLVYRKMIRIDRGGIDRNGQWFEWDSDQGATSSRTLGTGFGNGAVVRFYRLVAASGQPLQFSNGIGDVREADHLIFLGETTVVEGSAKLPQGGWMPNGLNRVYVGREYQLRRGDYAFLVLRRLSVTAEVLDDRVRSHFRGNFKTLRLDDGIEPSLVPHPGPIPDDFVMPGETCLQLNLTKNGPARAGQWLFHPYDQREGQWYSQLHPGSRYRFSVWLRAAGRIPTQVRAVFSGNPAYETMSQKVPWLVTDRWQNFTYDFIAGPYPTFGAHSGPGLEIVGPAVLYVDNLMLFKFDMKHDFEPNGPHEVSLDAWMAAVPNVGNKPAVRFCALSYQTSSVSNLLGNHDGNPTYGADEGAFLAAFGVTLPAIMNWAYKTGHTPSDRVIPFLTFAEEYTEQDWAAIAEYLGVPYDPEVDTPSAKPYSYQRYLQRGHGRPWSDEFREIILEYGNETWHNGAGGYGWDGFGAPGAVHQGGKEYGLFARYMFQEQLRKLAFWSKYHLGEKLKLALGANYAATTGNGGSYGEAAVMNNSVTDYLGHANYVGPKWENADPGKSKFDAHGLQATLLGQHAMRQLIEDSAEVRREINGTLGRHYRLEAYEGGPSGYWTNKGKGAEVDELYGKSLAMGVAALDTWLFSSQNGYTHQCYLGFGSGVWWTSHSMPEAGGFRAHPGWIALQLRNVYARGTDMLAVEALAVPSLILGDKSPKERIPLTSVYALRDNSSLSVFVLSRKFPGKHDGQDFGNGYTPVTLRLPLEGRPRRITLHKLSHPDGSPANPAENNRQCARVAIHSSEIPVTVYHPDGFHINEESGGGRDGIPPGTVYLYVFEP